MRTDALLDCSKRAQQQEEKLEMSQHLEAVARLAGGIAHEMLDRLGLISGYVEVALERMEPGAPLAYELRQIMTVTQGTAELVQQLLALAGQQQVTAQTVNLSTLMSQQRTALQRLVGDQIHVEFHTSAEAWPVRVGVGQIEQILTNLVLNSRDAITGAGQITIAIKNVQVDATWCAQHAGAEPGEYVCLQVSDTGHGMDANTLAHIFEPFFTTKTASKGMGLGLYVVYGIVKQHKGFINVESAPGQGTEVSIYLPRYNNAKTEAPASCTARTPVELRGTETILLVDDDEIFVEMCRHLLEQYSYTVIAASSPYEALQLAAQEGQQFDLLLVDVIMPMMNGYELSQRVTAHQPQVKTLYMSGYSAEAVANCGIDAARAHFMQKPFTAAALAQAVRAVLAE